MTLASRFQLRSTLLPLIVGFTALVGIVATTFWLSEQAQTYFSRVVAARDARSAAVDLRGAIQSAESSQRGFLVSGNEIYLAPYDTAKTLAERKLPTVIADFRSYNPAAAEHLENVIRNKLAEMDRSIALKKERRDGEAMTVFNRNVGKALMDEANVFFAGIVRTADARLIAAAAEERENVVWLRWVSILGAIVIVAVGSFATISVLHHTRQLRAARDRVAELNEGLEERVQHRTADLAQANEEIRRFAHIVSHDLRAPLVNIMGFSGELEASAQDLSRAVDSAGESDISALLREKLQAAVSDDIPESIEFIRTATKKMDSLINAVLKLSRDGRRAIRPEQIDLAELLRAGADIVGYQVSEAQGAITFDLGVTVVESDRLSLEQIIGNLFDNAVKYRAEDRPLRIDVRTTSTDSGGFRIEFADNGRGIADKDLARIFDMFTRSGPRNRPGEGIGLAFVQALVRNLGGTIEVSSGLGVGTTFTLTFQRIDPASSERQIHAEV